MKKILSIVLVLALMLSIIPIAGSAYADSSGTWKKDPKGWWYQNADGTYPANEWKKIDGKWYHFDAKGYMQTGWQKIDGKWYYFNSGGDMVSGWQKIDGKWYYFKSGGDMVTGWQKIDSKWYYFKSGGDMVTGWQKIDGKWYYFNGGGDMVTGWKQLSGNWYYFNSGGIMQTGWQKIGGSTFYLKPSGIMAANEWCKGYWLNKNGTWTYEYKASWKKDSKGWYYQDTSGWYAKNTTYTIDDKEYKFNKSGYWIDGVNIKPEYELPETITLNSPYDESSLSAVNVITMANWLKEKTGIHTDAYFDRTASGANIASRMLSADADGSQLMVIGIDALKAYCQGIWTDDPTDASKFRIVSGFIEPDPYTGCIIITQADEPYSTWDELVAYAKANPGVVRVADRAGSIMTDKLKTLFNQTGLSEYVTWVPCSSDSVKTGIHPSNRTINIAIFDEASAVRYLQQPDSYKAIINCRINNDFSSYPEDTKGLDLMKAVPTLLDVFGKEKAADYNLPNINVIIAKAGTPDELIDYLRAEIDALGDVEYSTDSNSFYQRQRINGGTSKYYAFTEEEVRAEWKRMLPVLMQICN